METITRAAEMKELLTAMGLLSAKVLSKTLITGPRKIGKTRFFEILVERGGDLLKEVDLRHRVVFLYIDLGRHLTIDDIRSEIGNQLAEKTGDSAEQYSQLVVRDIIEYANLLEILPIFLYDHLDRALGLKKLKLDDYFEIFCESESTLRFSWIAPVRGIKKRAYIDSLKKDTSEFGVAISSILDRAEEFNLKQLGEDDAKEVLKENFSNREMTEDSSLFSEMYEDAGGIPFLLERGVSYLFESKSSWNEIRYSFKESIRDEVFQYYPSIAELRDSKSRMKVNVQKGVSFDSGTITDNYRPFFIEEGLCPPDGHAIPRLVCQLIEEECRPTKLPKVGSYYVFLIDHENLLKTIKDCFEKDRPDIFSYHPRGRPNSMYGTDYYANPMHYKDEHEKLMKHIVRKFKERWLAGFGIQRMDVAKAYADWAHWPRPHYKIYKQNGIETDEPDMTVHRGDQAVDHKIHSDLWKVIKPKWEETGKNPYLIVVAGDGGYYQVLKNFIEEGADFQFWFFKFCGTRPGQNPVVLNMDSSKKVFLEDILQLKTFNF